MLWALLLASPFTYVANIAGGTVAETGRQPWVVYGVLRTKEAVTDAGGLPVAFFLLLLTYLTLLGAVVWLLRRLTRAAPETELETPGRLRSA